jgi:hypothetical protein
VQNLDFSSSRNLRLSVNIQSCLGYAFLAMDAIVETLSSKIHNIGPTP